MPRGCARSSPSARGGQGRAGRSSSERAMPTAPGASSSPSEPTSSTTRGMGPCLAVVGSTIAAVFEAYVGRALAPVLRPGQVVVLDNLGAHKGERVRELIEERGCELLFLPPYSLDLNPIEEAS